MSKRQEIRQKRARQERTQQIMLIVGIVIVAAAIVGWIALSQQPVAGMVPPRLITVPQPNLNAAGDPNAPVKIIEYADFQCPFCMNFWRDTEAQVMDTYVKTGKVYFIYRSVGAFLGAGSARAAEAAYCAGDQGKFWDMHDSLFTNQGPENANSLADNRIVAIAQQVSGLDMGAFNTCFTGGKYASKVTQDGADAQKDIPAGSNFAALIAAGQYSSQGISTPTFLVNGTIIPGAAPFSDFQKAIDAALTAAGKK